MRRLILIVSGLIVAAACLVLSAMPAFGDESGTINAKVRVAAPCLTVAVSGGVLDFGTLPFTTSSSPGVGVQGNGFSTVTNCGQSAQSLAVRGTDATAAGSSGALWSLVTFSGQGNLCTLGPDKYSVLVDDFTTLTGTVVTKTNQVMPKPVLQPGATESIDYDFYMPCSGSGGAGETMNLQIIYTAML
jgi:hypothetical protein